MIAKRIIGVVTVREGWAVQSFGYRRYLPLGKPEVLIENLDRWGADEILVQCVDRTRNGLGPDFALLERIARQGVSTPLVYAGGIRSAQDAVDAIGAAADRVAFDALLHDDMDQVARAGARLGNQAIVGALPSVREGWLDYRTGSAQPFCPALIEALESGTISEALVIDPIHEGYREAFDQSLLDLIPGSFPLIAFGGISESAQVRALLSRPRIVAVGVGNFLAYREHAVQALKEAADGIPMRPAAYYETRYA